MVSHNSATVEVQPRLAPWFNNSNATTAPPLPVPAAWSTPAFYAMIIAAVAAVVFYGSAVVAFARQRRREQNRRILEAMKADGGVPIGDEDDAGPASHAAGRINTADDDNVMSMSTKHSDGPRRRFSSDQDRKPLPRYASSDSLGVMKPKGVLRDSARLEPRRKPVQFTTPDGGEAEAGDGPSAVRDAVVSRGGEHGEDEGVEAAALREGHAPVDMED